MEALNLNLNRRSASLTKPRGETRNEIFSTVIGELTEYAAIMNNDSSPGLYAERPASTTAGAPADACHQSHL